AYLRQTNLVEVDRQQLGGAGLVIIVSLVKLHRQQPYFKIVATVERTVAHDRAAAVHQTGKQTRALLLRNVERHLAIGDADQPAFTGLETEGDLLTGTAHELAATEIADRLTQATLELIALDRPLHLLQSGLETDGMRRQAQRHAGQQADQEEIGRTHDRLHGG